jgi:nicotinate phosphoribosyltransferase
VDTYDTMNGIRNAIAVADELGIRERVGVRLDSGDLDRLAREARSLLDEAGLTTARIFVSGGLDEHEVARLVAAGAPVDAFGIGTQLGVSADAPYVDSIYKLVEYDGRGVMKLSSGKVSAPGRKQVWREQSGEADVLGLRDEDGPEGWTPLLEPVMGDGERLRRDPTIVAMRERFDADLARVPATARRLVHAEPVTVRRSQALDALSKQVRHAALDRAGTDAKA